MAGQPGGDFKFLKTLFLTGFAAFAVALFLQRRESCRYGHDLYTRETNINVPILADLNIDAPATHDERELRKILDKWKNDGMSHQVYLSRAKIIPAGRANAGQPNIDPAVVKDTPMLVKCDDGSIWAYVNDKRPGHNAAVIAQRIPQDVPARWDLYKGLHFPVDGVQFSPDREKRGSGVVKNITNVDIVKDLETNAHHLHVSKNHAHKDTRMDNRFLILKNEVAANPPAVPVAIGPHYYIYAQDRNGVYHLRRATPEIMQHLDLDEMSFAAGKHKQVARDKDLIHALLDQAHNGGDHIRAANPRFTDAQLEQLSAGQRQKTLFFSGGVGAVVGMKQASQVFSTASYAVMNKMHGPGSIKDKIEEQLEPIRTRFDLPRRGG